MKLGSTARSLKPEHDEQGTQKLQRGWWTSRGLWREQSILSVQRLWDKCLAPPPLRRVPTWLPKHRQNYLQLNRHLHDTFPTRQWSRGHHIDSLFNSQEDIANILMAQLLSINRLPDTVLGWWGFGDKWCSLDQTRFGGGEREVGVTLKDEVFIQRSLIRKLDFEKIQKRLFILKN